MKIGNMQAKADYPGALNYFFGVKVIIQRYCLDNKIILFGQEHRPDPLTITRDISVWDLDTGIIRGTCSLNQVQELHCSPKRFIDIRQALEVH